MNLIDQYLHRSQEIIGDRTESEEQYDNEVVKWLKEGLTIRKAIDKANERHPGEALQLDETNVADVAAHYEYLMQHMEIRLTTGQPPFIHAFMLLRSDLPSRFSE